MLRLFLHQQQQLIAQRSLLCARLFQVLTELLTSGAKFFRSYGKSLCGDTKLAGIQTGSPIS
ncbi:MAG TPA: hypothetical protein VMB49_07925 [Acidobacteriaceae bacterium]|nr:hypothetical protein [Acidobacteriaceae bacterium]